MKIKIKKRELVRNFRLLGIFLVSLFCVYPAFAVIITEINFDPSGSDTNREWIEIYNDTGTTIDFTTYKFFEANVNHGISVVFGDKNISAGEYVVLVQDLNKFKTDFPGYTGKIFESSFSLSNTGESISIKDSGGSVLNVVTYLQTETGAKDGETISFDGSKFVKTVASPGSGNIQTTTGNTGTSSTTNSTTTQTTTTTIETTTGATFQPTYFYRSYWPESEKIYIYSGENKTGLTGADMNFEVRAVNGEKKVLTEATFFWSFGDGNTKEGKNVKNIFKFPGEYVVNVDGFYNGNTSSDKIYVKITDPNISLKLKNMNREDVVEVFNNSVNEIDIGGLVLKSYSADFNTTQESQLPKKLSILPKKSINISASDIKMATSTSEIYLNYQTGKTLAKFVLPNLTKKIPENTQPINTTVATGTFKIYTKEEFENLPKIASTTTNITKNIPTKKILYKPVPKPILENENKVEENKNIDEKTENSFVVKNENNGIFQNFLKIFK